MDSGVNKSSKILGYLKDSFWITVGLLLYGCAWNIFVLPHGFVGGGLGGICAMLYYLFDFNMSLGYLLFNVVLCGIALIILGREFSIKTVFGILGLVFFLWVIPWLFPELIENPVIKDKLLSAIAGGAIAGTGCAFYLLRGASTGGSDIIVMIISKYKNVSWGRVYLIFDACVISSSFFLPSSTLETVAYGFVFMGVAAYTVDLVSNGKRQSVQMFIFTSKYREVADQIIHRHHRGATLFESIGWYTKQHRKTIFLVAKKRESQEIFKTVKAIDENAFIAVSNVMSVFGMGFDAIKAGFSKAVLKDENGNVISDGKKALKDGEASSNADDDELTEVFTPPGGVVEVPVNESIMKDENDAIERIKAGSDKTFNPVWQTPSSELIEIPEMPVIPKEMAPHAVEHYDSTGSLPRL